MGIGEDWFPTAGIGLIKKDLAQSKVYTYFNIGDTKSLVKLKEKQSKFPRSCSYTHLLANFGDFFPSLFLSFSQITKLFTDIVTIAYSLLE